MYILADDLMILFIWSSTLKYYVNHFYWTTSIYFVAQGELLNQLWSWGGAVVRALASHQYVSGSIPGPGVICGLSLLLVLVLAPRVFLRVFRFSSLLKNQHFQIPIRSGIWWPRAFQSKDCYVLPSLNKVNLYIYFLLLPCMYFVLLVNYY